MDGAAKGLTAPLCRLAYDGRGNYMVPSEEEMAEAVEALGGYESGLYAEAWVPYVKVCGPVAAHWLMEQIPVCRGLGGLQQCGNERLSTNETRCTCTQACMVCKAVGRPDSQASAADGCGQAARRVDWLLAGVALHMTSQAGLAPGRRGPAHDKPSC